MVEWKNTTLGDSVYFPAGKLPGVDGPGELETKALWSYPDLPASAFLESSGPAVEDKGRKERIFEEAPPKSVQEFGTFLDEKVRDDHAYFYPTKEEVGAPTQFGFNCIVGSRIDQFKDEALVMARLYGADDQPEALRAMNRAVEKLHDRLIEFGYSEFAFESYADTFIRTLERIQAGLQAVDVSKLEGDELAEHKAKVNRVADEIERLKDPNLALKYTYAAPAPDFSKSAAFDPAKLLDTAAVYEYVPATGQKVKYDRALLNEALLGLLPTQEVTFKGFSRGDDSPDRLTLSNGRTIPHMDMRHASFTITSIVKNGKTIDPSEAFRAETPLQVTAPSPGHAPDATVSLGEHAVIHAVANLQVFDEKSGYPMRVTEPVILDFDNPGKKHVWLVDTVPIDLTKREMYEVSIDTEATEYIYERVKLERTEDGGWEKKILDKKREPFDPSNIKATRDLLYNGPDAEGRWNLFWSGFNARNQAALADFKAVLGAARGA